MTERLEGLTAFYGGPIWKKHRETANATMIDSDNVLLLRPARPSSGFLLGSVKRPKWEESVISGSVVLAVIYYFDKPASDEFIDYFEREVRPIVSETGASILASFVSDNHANNFPALPVREGENVFVCFSGFRNQTAYKDHVALLANWQGWYSEVTEKLPHLLVREMEVLRLSPTARSRLR